MSKLIPTYIEQGLRIEQLERELAAAIASFSEERDRAQREGARVIKLQVELAEAKKDAERYRAWFGSNELDNNIDAAMKEGEK